MHTYQKDDNNYVKVGSIDSLYVVKATDVTNATLLKIPAILDIIINQVLLNSSSSVNISNAVSIDEINQVSSKRRAQFTINSSPDNLKGVYRTFEDFRNNRIDALNYVIEQKKDGSYRVLEQSKDNSSNGKFAKEIWGMNDGKEPYIRINRTFIPLEKKNNTFYFIVSIKDFPQQTIPEETSVEMTGLSNVMVTYMFRKSEFYLDMDTGNLVEYKIIHQ
jgi:hypothetical protein